MAKDRQAPAPGNPQRTQPCHATRRRRFTRLSWIVLAASIALSLWAAQWTWQQRKESAHAQFSARTSMAAAALATYINASESRLRAAATMLESRPDADREYFHAFVEKLRLDDPRAGIRGVGFARVVDDAGREAYLARRRLTYGPDFDIYPAGRREHYAVIDMIYPESPGLRLLLGKDVADEARRREAMQRATDTGKTTMALQVALTDRARGDPGADGFLLYSPVYSGLLPSSANVTARRAHLLGFTTAGFGWNEVLDEVLGTDGTGQFDIELLTLPGTAAPAFASRQLRARHGRDMRPAFSTTYPINVLGEQWLLRFDSPPASRAVPGLPYVILQALCGIGLGLVLFLQLQQNASRARRNRALLDTVADRLPVLAAYLGADRRYGFANRATATWFGTDRTWRGSSLEEAHADDPGLLALLQQALAEPDQVHTRTWETEIGRPPRAVQLHLVPELRSDHGVAGWYLLANDTSEQARSRRSLQHAHEQLRQITDKLPAYIAQYDRDLRVVFRNSACHDADIWQRPCEVGVSLRELLDEAEYEQRKAYAEAALAGEDVEFTSVLHRGTPRERHLHTHYTPLTDESGQVTSFLAMKTDVTEYTRLQDALYDARERAEVTLTSISEAVLVTDVDRRISYMNPAAEAISGWSLQEARGLPADQVVPLSRMPGSAVEGDANANDLELQHRDGRRMRVEVSRSQLHDSNKQPIGHVMVLRDVTEARALSARMSYLAHHDPLTGLPNRLQLGEMLGHVISNASRRGNGLAVLFIDLDLFKHVNDGLGHHVGDLLLQQVARRLQRCIGEAGSVYRTGGDEFVVLLHNVITRNDVEAVAERLLQIRSTPYHVDAHELYQTFSIGISLFPDDGYDTTTLMMRADAAMYLAKRSGRNASRFYTAELAASADARLELESSLRRSLRENELQLYYQPRVDLRSGRIVGAEALLRWPRGDRVLVPTEFLPVAEETSLIAELDQWALRAACRQARAWQLAGLPLLRISINIAAANFDNDRLLGAVDQALQESNLDPDCLELELTETSLVRDAQRTDHMLAALKESGVHIAIDDFGTGFSNLGYLGRYGFNVLKIDRSFTSGITTDNGHEAITRAIIGLARQMCCRTVAEGVETPEQARWLARHGCDELQGYLFSEPLPAAQFAALLASRAHWSISAEHCMAHEGSPPASAWS